MKHWILVLFVGLFFFSCDETQIDLDPDVVTEELLYISGDRLVITGRILSTSDIQITDHGFWIAPTEDFANASIISLGERLVPGRFVGETESLQIENTYFGKAFVEIQGQPKFGNTLEFNTLGPTIQSYSPALGLPRQGMTITGSNFATDTKVKFGDQFADIENIEAESVIELKIPEFAGNVFEQVKVIVQGKELVFDDAFEFVTGKFTPIGPSFGNTLYLDNIFFQEGGQFYFGLGWNNDANTVVNDFHQIDPATGTWSEISFPGPALGGSFFCDNYFGSGSLEWVVPSTGIIEMTNQFWKFENGNFIALSDLPFELYQGAALRNNDQIYVYGGELNDRKPNRTIHVYDIQNDTWTQTGSQIPINIVNTYPAFAHQGRHYFVLKSGEVWQYTIDSDEWKQMADFPGPTGLRLVSEIIGDKAYVGVSINDRRMWEYDVSNDSWKRKSSFPFTSEALKYGSWVVDDHIYLFMRTKPESNNRSIWLFEPNTF